MSAIKRTPEEATTEQQRHRTLFVGEVSHHVITSSGSRECLINHCVRERVSSGVSCPHIVRVDCEISGSQREGLKVALFGDLESFFDNFTNHYVEVFCLTRIECERGAKVSGLATDGNRSVLIVGNGICAAVCELHARGCR